MKQQYTYRIGHPSYNGANARANATTRAAAIRILRDRGVTRDNARLATSKDYTAVRPAQSFDVIECMRIDADLI